MKKMMMVVMALMVIGASAQTLSDTQLGYYKPQRFVTMTVDESCNYRYVQAMDEESLTALTTLLSGKRATEDKSILRIGDDLLYVHKDFLLPEGNYYVSDIYKHDDVVYKTVIVHPGITVVLYDGYQIDGILERLGSKVTVDTSQNNGKNYYELVFQMGTSEEVMEAVQILNGLYESGEHGIMSHKPKMTGLTILPDDLAETYNLGPVDENGMRLIHEEDYTSMAEFNFWGIPNEMDNYTLELVEDGLAITNFTLQSEIWHPQVVITEDCLALEENHDYIVRLTLKVPSDGTYQVQMGSWTTAFSQEVPATASDDWQVIDVEFPQFGANSWNDGFVILQNGWVVGTTVLKKVQVYEKVKDNETTAEPIYYGFAELTLDESFIYKFVKAMDAESQKAINDLLAGKQETEDRSIIKRSEGEWYVKKDYPLPEGNYYESAFYRKKNGQINMILPRITVIMQHGFQIDELMKYLGDRVTLESSDNNSYYLACQAKTSEEVLETCLLINDCGYDHGILGISRFTPDRYWLDSNPLLVEILTGNYQPFDPNYPDEKLIYEVNWEGLPYPYISEEGNPCEMTDEGLAITNFTLQSEIWYPQVVITEDCLALEENHDYIVRLTMKVPSDGTYQMQMGSWTTAFSQEVPVTASDDWQVIDVEFPQFGANLWNDGFVILQNGWVVGTTVLKKVQVYEKVKGGETAVKAVKATKVDDAIYNLSGQKVDASYKGIVIRNGKKIYRN